MNVTNVATKGNQTINATSAWCYYIGTSCPLRTIAILLVYSRKTHLVRNLYFPLTDCI